MGISIGHTQSVIVLPADVLGAHNSTILSAVASLTINVPAGARWLFVQAATQNARYTMGPASAPSSSVGFVLTAGAIPVVLPLGKDVTLKFIAESAGAVLQYQFMK